MSKSNKKFAKTIEGSLPFLLGIAKSLPGEIGQNAANAEIAFAAGEFNASSNYITDCVESIQGLADNLGVAAIYLTLKAQGSTK